MPLTDEENLMTESERTRSPRERTSHSLPRGNRSNVEPPRAIVLPIKPLSLNATDVALPALRRIRIIRDASAENGVTALAGDHEYVDGTDDADDDEREARRDCGRMRETTAVLFTEVFGRTIMALLPENGLMKSPLRVLRPATDNVKWMPPMSIE